MLGVHLFRFRADRRILLRDRPADLHRIHRRSGRRLDPEWRHYPYYGDDGEAYDTRLYGAWMQHGAFVIGTLAGELFAGISVTGSVGLSGGDLTGTGPAGGAAWRGIMVGAPRAERTFSRVMRY